MPVKIHLLPEDVSRAIAAGEVIERPASVVKELVENAIDAGSSEIVVELEGGGLQRIRVYDNGEGMNGEDVPLALKRYATSKIEKAEDLYAIDTLGFRGEALPSIASVSQMTLKTRVAHSISGVKAVCEGGEIKSISEMGCPVGTEIEVRDLFYNVPVRRKFLRSIQSELRQSLSYFLRLSLSHPFISFRLIHDGRALYDLPRTESPLVRIEAILGREVSDHLQAFEFEDGEINAGGYASLPTISRANGDGIYVYVNRRFVKDRMIYKAVLDAYRHVIPAGKFPLAVLFLKLPPSSVDVNVHPTKVEVKFKDQERIFRAVNGTLRSVLSSGPSTGVLPDGKEERVYSPAVQLPLQGPDGKRETMVHDVSVPGWEPEGRTSIRILGQVRGTYVLCEGEGGMIFIDQHAAHERILFERLKKEHEASSVFATRFLIPIQIELSAEESLILEASLEEFRSMGFDIDPMGKNAYALRSIPSCIDQKDAKEIIREIVDELSLLKGSRKGGETLHAILISLACHSAIRANSSLRREEMDELVARLSPFNLFSTCPHGRPIFYLIHSDELDKQFKRKPQRRE